MEDLPIIAPLDNAELEHYLLFDPDRAWGDLALLSEPQLVAQASSYTGWLSAGDSIGYSVEHTLHWWSTELERRARPARSARGEEYTRGTVYLLHFDAPLSPNHAARHYIGSTPGPVLRRLALHRRGRGARFTQVANERGITYVLARMWPGDRRFERRLKNQHNAPRLCPLCNAVLRPCVDDGSDIPF